MLLALVGAFFLLYKALRAMAALAEQAVLSSKAVSARDLAEAREYSADAAFSRELTKAATGPAIATVSQPEDTYTTPEGVELKVLRPFL
jgi:hypothetical protein